MFSSKSEIFQNRSDAGRKLAKALEEYKDRPNAIVISLPRGGVILGHEISHSLHLPHDILVPRKIGAPHHEEFAIGALTEDGEVQLDEASMKYFGIKKKDLEPIIERERKEAQRRLKTYRGDKPPVDFKDKVVLLVDDGIATGRTAMAAITSLKNRGVKEVILAAPVASPRTLKEISGMADKLVVLAAPEQFHAVGQFYQHFDQTTDDEVLSLLGTQA